MAKKETLLILCAHNDDQIIGAGGTIVKYKKEGKRVVTVVFSYGEMSHPHIKGEVTKGIRLEELRESDKILGIDKTINLGLKEGQFPKEIIDKKVTKKIVNLIRTEKPSKIFTHNIDDPMPDHRAVYKLVQAILDTIKVDAEVYTFNVWNIFNFRKRDVPKLVVDISKSFQTKIKAFKAHKSQKMAMISLLWNVYLQAILNGWSNNTKYAEVFLRIK